MDDRSASGSEAGPSGYTSTHSHVPAAPLKEEWRVEWASTLPTIEQFGRCQRRPGFVHINRASQLDALRLDEEIFGLVKEQLMQGLKYFDQGTISNYVPEISAILSFLMFYGSVWRGRSTPGSSILNLRYRDERSVSRKNTNDPTYQWGGNTGVEGPGLSLAQRIFYGLGTVLLPYAWTRVEGAVSRARWGFYQAGPGVERAWKAMYWADAAYKVANALNYVWFLREGRYRTVLERLLRARLVYIYSSYPRATSFEYMNRQLVWHELSEFALFVLPLINLQRIRSWLREGLPQTGVFALAAAKGEDVAENSCPICKTADITVPFTALPCQHRFCYYCLRSHTLADPQFRCPACLVRVEAMQRHAPRMQYGPGDSLQKRVDAFRAARGLPN